MKFEKKYSLLAIVLSIAMVGLGWMIKTYHDDTRYKQPIIPALPVSFQVNTSTGVPEAWYTHTPLKYSKQQLEKDATIRRLNLKHLISETQYDSDTSAPTATFLRETDKYKLYEVLIPTEKGLSPIEANLYIPKNITLPAPTILFLHGHFEDNSLFERPAGHGRAANFHAVKHAEAGFITMAVENRGVGYFRAHQGFDQVSYINYELLQGRSFVAVSLLDIQKAYAYLRAQPEVDIKRIGVAGVSLGGELTEFIGALDTRFKAVVISGYLNLYQGLLSGSVHDLFWYGVLSKVGESPQIASLIAPRPLLIQQGTKDEEFYGPAYRHNNADEAYKYLQDVYSIYETKNNISRDLFDGGHQYMNTSSIEFFQKNL